MTCKDCISFAKCLEYECTPYYGLDSACNNVEQLCENFKNKADFVEVVRCKDCKRFIKKGEEYLNNDIFGYCEKSRTGFFDDGEEVYGKDFCSYGERKDT